MSHVSGVIILDHMHGSITVSDTSATMDKGTNQVIDKTKNVEGQISDALTISRRVLDCLTMDDDEAKKHNWFESPTRNRGRRNLLKPGRSKGSKLWVKALHGVRLSVPRRCLWASFSFLIASLWSFDPDLT
jgi:hypothetical protein